MPWCCPERRSPSAIAFLASHVAAIAVVPAIAGNGRRLHLGWPPARRLHHDNVVNMHHTGPSNVGDVANVQDTGPSNVGDIASFPAQSLCDDDALLLSCRSLEQDVLSLPEGCLLEEVELQGRRRCVCGDLLPVNAVWLPEAVVQDEAWGIYWPDGRQAGTFGEGTRQELDMNPRRTVVTDAWSTPWSQQPPSPFLGEYRRAVADEHVQQLVVVADVHCPVDGPVTTTIERKHQQDEEEPGRDVTSSVSLCSLSPLHERPDDEQQLATVGD